MLRFMNAKNRDRIRKIVLFLTFFCGAYQLKLMHIQNWATSRRKPNFEGFDQVRLEPACSATKAS